MSSKAQHLCQCRRQRADAQAPAPDTKCFVFYAKNITFWLSSPEIPKIFNPKLPRFSIVAPCSHFIFLQFLHFYEISAFSLIFTNYLLFLQYLAIIEVFFDISLLSLFLTHNQQISQTKFSKALRKILKSIYWMADKNRAHDFSQAPDLTFNKLTF